MNSAQGGLVKSADIMSNSYLVKALWNNNKKRQLRNNLLLIIASFLHIGNKPTFY